MRHRLLIVDDGALGPEMAAELIATGYRVLRAVSEAEALELAAVEAPHLILVTVDRPGADAAGLLARLKAGPSTRLIPVVALTLGRSVDAEHLVRVGFAASISKQFGGRLLAVLLDGLLETLPLAS